MGDGASIEAFFAGWELFGMPALAGAIAGGTLGLVGVYVVLRRLVFLSAAVSQAAAFGVACAFYVHANLAVAHAAAHHTLGATIFTTLAVLPFALERGKPSARRDSVLGAIFLAGAAGTLALGTRIVQELQDIQTILFGSAVAVLPEDFNMLAAVAVGMFLLHVWWWRGFAAVSFDREGAKVRGMPVLLLDVVLFLSLALAISASTQVLGALPTFAFSVLPAMAAIQVARNVQASLVLAVVFGAISGFAGYLAAFLFELPVGASQTLVALAVVVLVSVPAVIRSLRRLG